MKYAITIVMHPAGSNEKQDICCKEKNMVSIYVFSSTQCKHVGTSTDINVGQGGFCF